MEWWKSTSNKIDVEKVKYSSLISKSVEGFKAITESELKEGTQYRFVTTRAFNAITVIDWILRTNTIDEIILAVYRLNLKSVNYLVDYVNDNKSPVYLLLSDFFRENKKYERWTRELDLFAKKDNTLTVRYANNHAKICLVKSKSKHIVFEGSGNLSDNARIEQYLLENNKTMYEFHKKWITDDR